MKKLAIFDYDGTLIDSYSDAIRCINDILSEINKEPIINLKTTFEETIRELSNREDISKEEFKTVMLYFNQRFFNYQKENTKPFDGVYDVLSELEKNGVLLAINSKKPEDELIQLNNKYFGDLNFLAVTGFDWVNPNKPNPFKVLKIIEKANLTKEEVVYVGDSISDIKTAENAGIDIILVSWGQSNEKIRSNDYIDFLVNKPEEILKILLKKEK